jgi:phospholipid/cholesterol/gamma-HCH transport system substrate-binding protein
MMKQSRTMEILVGLFVAAGLAALFMLAMSVSNLRLVAERDTYLVTAEFQNIGGLRVRSPVTLAGVTIGRVALIQIDPLTYEAQVMMRIESQHDYLPEDTSASIFTSGLLGEQYIALDPGGADNYLKDGDKITLTQSALVLEQIIGQFLYNVAGRES